jgi:hypothetical protein
MELLHRSILGTDPHVRQHAASRHASSDTGGTGSNALFLMQFRYFCGTAPIFDLHQDMDL